MPNAPSVCVRTGFGTSTAKEAFAVLLAEAFSKNDRSDKMVLSQYAKGALMFAATLRPHLLRDQVQV